jgi:ribosomal subunit interface protein
MTLKTNLKTKNIEVDQDIKDYLAKRINKFEQLIAEDTSPVIADIELEKRAGQQSGDIFRAEVNLKAGDHYLRSEENAENVKNAIDAMQEQMVRELRDAKEKKQSQTRAGARKAKEAIRSQANDVDENTKTSN